MTLYSITEHRGVLGERRRLDRVRHVQSIAQRREQMQRQSGALVAMYGLWCRTLPVVLVPPGAVGHAG